MIRAYIRDVWGHSRRVTTLDGCRTRSARRRVVWLAVAAALATLGTAAVSSPVAAQADGGSDEVRIVARKLADDRIEFGLQHRNVDDSWGDRRLPSSRFFPADVAVDRWLRSSPLTVSVAATSTPLGAGRGGAHRGAQTRQRQG